MHHLFCFVGTVEGWKFSVLIPVELRLSASPPQGVLAAEFALAHHGGAQSHICPLELDLSEGTPAHVLHTVNLLLARLIFKVETTLQFLFPPYKTVYVHYSADSFKKKKKITETIEKFYKLTLKTAPAEGFSAAVVSHLYKKRQVPANFCNIWKCKKSCKNWPHIKCWLISPPPPKPEKKEFRLWNEDLKRRGLCSSFPGWWGDPRKASSERTEPFLRHGPGPTSSSQLKTGTGGTPWATLVSGPNSNINGEIKTAMFPKHWDTTARLWKQIEQI